MIIKDLFKRGFTIEKQSHLKVFYNLAESHCTLSRLVEIIESRKGLIICILGNSFYIVKCILFTSKGKSPYLYYIVLNLFNQT